MLPFAEAGITGFYLIVPASKSRELLPETMMTWHYIAKVMTAIRAWVNLYCIY